MGRNWHNLWGICFTRRCLLCRLWMPEAADAVWPDFQWQESSVSGPSCKRRASQNSMRWNALCEWYDMIVCLCVDWCLLSYIRYIVMLLAAFWQTTETQRPIRDAPGHKTIVFVGIFIALVLFLLIIAIVCCLLFVLLYICMLFVVICCLLFVLLLFVVAFCSPTEWNGIFSQLKTPTGTGFWVPAVFWRFGCGCRCGKGSGKLFEAAPSPINPSSSRQRSPSTSRA